MKGDKDKQHFLTSQRGDDCFGSLCYFNKLSPDFLELVSDYMRLHITLNYLNDISRSA